MEWRHQTNGQRPSSTNRSARLFASLGEGNRARLRIRDIGERDYGAYECVAINTEGRGKGVVGLTGKVLVAVGR